MKQSYDDNVQHGITKAAKLAEHWKALRTELDQASASLSQAVGLAVCLTVVACSDDDAPSADRGTSHTHITAKICHLLRLSCPDLKFESVPLAYMRSCPEGLPFVFWCGSSFSNRFTASDERRLQNDLQRFMGHLLSSVQTGSLVRELAERAKQQASQHESMERQRLEQTLSTASAPADSSPNRQEPHDEHDDLFSNLESVD